VRVDVIAGHEPSARPERSFSGKPRSGGGGSGKDWGNKPRSSSGGYQGRGGSWAGQNAGQGQGQGQGYAGSRPRADDNRGNSSAAPAGAGAGSGWQGRSDSRPAWNNEARPAAAKPAHSWDRPEKTAAHNWVKPEGRPAAKSGNTWGDDHRPAAAGKPRGRQSW
jgi:hypothetical protein